jgi:hypothetical protein
MIKPKTTGSSLRRMCLLQPRRSPIKSRKRGSSMETRSSSSPPTGSGSTTTQTSQRHPKRSQERLTYPRVATSTPSTHVSNSLVAPASSSGYQLQSAQRKLMLSKQVNPQLNALVRKPRRVSTRESSKPSSISPLTLVSWSKRHR